MFTRAGGKAMFEYSDDWRHGAGAFPISLALPLSRARTEGAAALEFLDGLLPDNDGVRGSWGRKFQVDAGNPFALLRYVGRDVAGAMQYVDPDSDLPVEEGGERRLDESALALFIKRGLEESATWGVPGSAGRFSLAGQQAKMAVCREDDEWMQPTRDEPSTHILKPGLVDYDGSALAEHLTMRLAAEVGLNVAQTEMVKFEDVFAVAVTRFDRRRAADGEVERVHQEDFCQALGVSPRLRYENDGGPGLLDMAEVLSQALPALASVSAKRALLDAVAFNWLTLGTDAHAKNYSLQHDLGGSALAPLYDLMSAAPYPKQIDPRAASTKLAQAIGGEYRFRWVAERHWAALARGLGRKPKDVVARVEELGVLISERASQVAEVHGKSDIEFADRWQSSVRRWVDGVRQVRSS